MTVKSVLVEQRRAEAERLAEASASLSAYKINRNLAILRSDKETADRDTASAAVAGTSIAGGVSALAIGALIGGTGGLVGIVFGGTLMLFGFVAAIMPHKN